MVRIISSPALSEQALMKKWNEDNPNHEYKPRSKRDTLLVNWSKKAPTYQVALDEDRLIGYIGIIEYDTFLVGGGIRVSEEYQNKDKLKIGTKLIEARQEKIDTLNKPIIQEINVKTMPVEKFINVWKRYGWVANPITSIRGIPKEVLEDYKKSKNQFLVYSPDDDAFGKAWRMICPMKLEYILPFME